MDGFSRQAYAPSSQRARGVPARASIAGEAIHEEAEMAMAFPGYERSSSAEARGLGTRTQLQQDAWDRRNSADGVDPCGAKQLASAVEDKLKLAPILAKRLERVSHSSGSFSSRQSVAMANHHPSGTSGRSTPQRAIPASDFSKLNYLVTSLEGVRGERNLKVEGSARLPQVVLPVQSGSPTTSRNDTSHSFEEAKRQVDRDLRLFLADVRDLYQQISMREGADVPIVLEVIASIMDIAEECLETPVEDFKLTITDIVDNIEEERSSCQQRTIRALYTRLLFILTRCSRLLITEQQHLFATEPRNRRRHSQVFGPGMTTKTQKELGLHLPPQSLATDGGAATPKEEDEPVFRSHTMPVKAMYNMVQQLKREGPFVHSSGLTDKQHRPQLSRIASEIPDSPAVDPRDVSAPVVRHQSKSSELEAIPSISDGSVSSFTKKKKGFFGKISKGLKSFTDGFKRKSSKDKVGPDGLVRPYSEIANPQHVRFREPALEQHPRLTGSPGPSLRGAKSAALDGTDGDGELTPQRKLDNQRSVRFQEAPTHIIGSSEDAAAGARGGSALGGNGAGEADTGKRAKLSVSTDLARPMQEEQRASNSPQASSELEVLGARGRLFRRASVDLYAMGMSVGIEPMSPDGVSPEDLTVICSICEEAWLSTHLEEHSIHCAVLRTLSGNGLSVDAQLTTIANVLEEWLETPLTFPALGPAPSHYHVKNQLMKLIRAARNAAALQPDGSKVPTTRCFSIQAELAEMLESAAQTNKLAVVTQTYAHRVMRLITEKVNMLAEPFGGARVRAGGSSDAGDSGTSTPRSMPGMSIDEFEIIKPISRGAFGRVYLARKLATGDLFAIKVMKKRDLIRKNMVESVTNERNILAMAQNPFVVRFYYSFTSRENLYIVMEYINGGDCFSLLRKFGALDEEVARQYIAETVLALEYCHAQGIIHRDLKPDNLLINAQGHVKLTDFGLSCVGVIDRTDNLNGQAQPMDTDGPEQESESAWGGGAEATGDFSNSGAVPVGATSGSEPMDASKPDEGPMSCTWQDSGGPLSGRTSAPGQSLASLGMPPRPLGQHQRIVAPEHECRRAVGTPDYLAPELLLGTGHGPEVDWWALGTILYEFVTGTPPFNADTPEEIFDNILDRRITWPDEDDMSAECRDLIDKLLHPNPLKRLGHRGAGEVKLHPWFEGLDWTSLVRNKAAFIPTVEDETDTSYFESKHVSQRSMAEDLDKLRTSAPAERTSAHAQGPNSSPAGAMAIPGSGPSSGVGGGRTQVDRLKDQHHREGSGMRSTGSSYSHGSSHMSRTSYTGNAGTDTLADMARLCNSPFQTPYGAPDSGIPLPPGSIGRSSANQGLISGLMHPLHPRNSMGSSSCGGPLGALRSSGCGARNSGCGARNSGCGARNSGCCPRNSGNGARTSGSGARNSGSGARNSGSGQRASGSGSAGLGTSSERPSPGSVGTGGAATMSGTAVYGTEADAYGTEPYEYYEGDEDHLPEGEEEGEEEPQEEQQGNSGGEDTAELHTENDPFGNFSFTNFTGLSAANMEKIQKLREHFNRRTSYSGPDT
ncbi:hypothetical protein PLESTB_000081600 [Pleodorina starrii]|uniref:non-specific serine/threonine protein kinase n=1 Tax=Pleodorina starrii TaxID=330485 RepID=A0A9W6BA55_9CHLO|nr:hypothetical protein PLESTM_000078000 [Pleodorina starrii]GLC48304.1 hypothetical protein PLESTB_000081600 [Pleodorina starrii]GLC66589.1 hypothetical protein PLESTF_000447400 [Pleodorina starrii]